MLFFVRPTTPSELKIISVTKMVLPTLRTLLCLLCITVIEQGPQMPADPARQNDQTRLRRKNFLFLEHAALRCRRITGRNERQQIAVAFEVAGQQQHPFSDAIGGLLNCNFRPQNRLNP